MQLIIGGHTCARRWSIQYLRNVRFRK